jgi:mucin-2
MRHSILFFVLAMGAPAAAVFSACSGGTMGPSTGGSTTTTTPSATTATGTTTSGTTTSGTTTTIPIGVDCGAPSGSVQPYDSEASGTVVGSAVHADICNALAHLYVSPYTTPPDRVLLFLNSTMSSSITLDNPPGATTPILQGMISVSSASPGVYRSSDGTACGDLGFSFYLPVPPGVDCDGGAPPSCPPGCSTVCSGFGCDPCTPAAPEVFYGARASSDCLGNTTAVQGSWTLTLTSTEKIVGDAASWQTYYLPHGSLTATLVGVDGGADMPTLSVGF